MGAVEWVHYRRVRPPARRVAGRALHPWMWRCYCVVGVFGFGAASSQLLTDIAKYSIGRLRPHFWEVCRPGVGGSLIDCDDPKYKYKYIEDFECTGTSKRMKEVRLSFLSGHSSFSAYTMVFLVLYLQCRVCWRGSHLFRHIVQFICISLAWFTALSRVSNYKHHWSDVLAGSLLGTAVAVITVRFVSDFWRDPKPQVITNGMEQLNHITTQNVNTTSA